MTRVNLSRVLDIRGKFALSVISFIIGIQFRNVIDLFSSNNNVGNSNSSLAGEYYNVAWAPEVSAPASTQKIRAKQAQYKSTNSPSAPPKSQTDVPTVNPKIKKKKIKKIPKYNTMNFTQTPDNNWMPWSLPELNELGAMSSDEFMKNYIAEKRRLNMSLAWEKPQSPVKLPLPIFGLNFPKSATLTLKEYFSCGGIRAIHTSAQQGRLGICMRENLLAGDPPIKGCDVHKSKITKQFEPIDFISDIGLQAPVCYYASLHDGGLENIVEHHPDATIMLVTRNATSWHRSTAKWGQLLLRWRRGCGFDGEHDKKNAYWYKKWRTSDPEDYWVDFYHAHTQKIREFAMKHPSLTYVEVKLEDEEMGKKMEGYTGIPSDCVMDCHPGPKWVVEHPEAGGKCVPMGNTQALSTKNEQDSDDDGSTEDNEGNDEDSAEE